MKNAPDFSQLAKKKLMEQNYIEEHKAKCKIFWIIYYYFEIFHKKNEYCLQTSNT